MDFCSLKDSLYRLHLEASSEYETISRAVQSAGLTPNLSNSFQNMFQAQSIKSYLEGSAVAYCLSDVNLKGLDAITCTRYPTDIIGL